MDIVERLHLRPAREMLYLDGCVAAGYGPTIEAQAADEIEHLRRERDIALADLASLRTAFEDWKVFHSTSRLEAEHAAERYKLRQEVEHERFLREQAEAMCAQVQDQREDLRRERDEALAMLLRVRDGRIA